MCIRQTNKGGTTLFVQAFKCLCSAYLKCVTLSKGTTPVIKDTEVPGKHNTLYSHLSRVYNNDASHIRGLRSKPVPRA